MVRKLEKLLALLNNHWKVLHPKRIISRNKSRERFSGCVPTFRIIAEFLKRPLSVWNFSRNKYSHYYWSSLQLTRSNINLLLLKVRDSGSQLR